ncbi:MAG: Gfo/Idh/MocA family oxidoreductase [Clostridiales bacterium]|nr:Gfo/Idh/MocA family oxidoreductase [Clostridiales bacterium]
MKKRIAILGYGQRGAIYAAYALAHPEEFETVAVADTDAARRDLAGKANGCPVFSSCEGFFAAHIPCDVVAVCMQDKDHLRYAVLCMQNGYDILLEKPIAASLRDCLKIRRAAAKYNRTVVVCHVLRYTPFYSAIKKVLDDGVLGEIVTIEASENVGYYHQAHSFVRGPWRSSADSVPMIVAKCCHDMDLLRWLMDCRCEKVTSYGGLQYFTPKNAPPSSAPYCTDCPAEGCVYRAADVYKKYPWMAGYFSAKTDEESIQAALPHTPYDRCVFACDNDAVDHQVAVFEFEGGKTACFTMTAFSQTIYRDLKIHGTKGELVGIMEDKRFEVRLFTGETIAYEADAPATCGNHGGGDVAMMQALYRLLTGADKAVYSLDAGIDSHKMAFAAEKSRKTGKPVRVRG